MRISKEKAKNIWIHAQKLDHVAPFGKGTQAVAAAVRHLGYVQIDTISVIERCHHHILYNRIPDYRVTDLHQAQSKDKSVFEYWTHALAYISADDFRYFMAQMKSRRISKSTWMQSIAPGDYKKVKDLLKEGPISIRDIKDDVLIEKQHLWASSKPSKKALQLGFYTGEFTISERVGMLKMYDYSKRHFGWDKSPKAASEAETMKYILERSLRSQGLISLESTSYLEKFNFKQRMQRLIDKQVQDRQLVEVQIEGIEKCRYWIRPTLLEKKIPSSELTHILSPFDPLTIQRKRLKMFFDYEHVFEAYIPPIKRKFGYFALPVLMGAEIVAVIDLKTDRQKQALLVQKWTWLKKFRSKEKKKKIEAELDRFERFQFQ